ncbi:MAG: SRPBCC domain-containing protein, partial [Burkholderiales bacterium]
GTRLAYSVKASVGGKLAQIGSRLVDAAAKKIANDFFQAFNDKLAGANAGPAHDENREHEEHLPEPVPPDPDMPTLSSSSLAFFAAGALVVVAVCLFVLYG